MSADLQAYCQRDVETIIHLARQLAQLPLPSFTWLCENLNRWYIGSSGEIVVLK